MGMKSVKNKGWTNFLSYTTYSVLCALARPLAMNYLPLFNYLFILRVIVKRCHVREVLGMPLAREMF